MAAYVEGLRRDLEELASAQLYVTVEEVDGTHAPYRGKTWKSVAGWPR